MNVKQLPNLLTGLRIAMVPFYLFSLYFVRGSIGVFLALLVFVVAGITDYLDGYLARRLDCVTDLGKVIDPLADKLIVSVALISLAFEPFNLISLIVVIIILARELLVTILRKYYSARKIYLSANNWGKAKTATQMTGIIGSLLYAVLREYSFIASEYYGLIEQGIRIFFWVVTVITIVSGLSYVANRTRKN